MIFCFFLLWRGFCNQSPGPNDSNRTTTFTAESLFDVSMIEYQSIYIYVSFRRRPRVSGSRGGVGLVYYTKILWKQLNFCGEISVLRHCFRNSNDGHLYIFTGNSDWVYFVYTGVYKTAGEIQLYALFGEIPPTGGLNAFCLPTGWRSGRPPRKTHLLRGGHRDACCTIYYAFQI